MGDRLRDKIAELEEEDDWNDEFMSKEESLAYVYSVLQNYSLFFFRFMQIMNIIEEKILMCFLWQVIKLFKITQLFMYFFFLLFYIQDSICILARFICHPIKAPLRTTVEKELNSLKENFTNAVKKDKQDKDHIDAPPESARDILNRVINDFSSELVMNYVRDHTKYLY